MNFYHDVEPGTKDEMNVIVEIPKGSHNKYEIDKETGLIALDRANYSNAPYPSEYGFVPQTLWDDGDAVDVLVLATNPIPAGILVKSRPVGTMEMIDEGENDLKIIVVPVKDKHWDDVKDLENINKHTLKQLQHFFETYKVLKGGIVTIPRFGSRAEAEAAFEKGRAQYKAKMAK
jgi:inorganic pyrophosphatase